MGTFTFASNYPEFPDSCLRIEFTLFVQVLKVLVDGADIFSKSAAISTRVSQTVSPENRHSPVALPPGVG